MKTIAISIDEPTLERVDRLTTARATMPLNRSKVIRTALRAYLDELDRVAEEARERAILRRHARTLRRQAAALVEEQAAS